MYKNYNKLIRKNRKKMIKTWLEHYFENIINIDLNKIFIIFKHKNKKDSCVIIFYDSFYLWNVYISKLEYDYLCLYCDKYRFLFIKFKYI
ncbi:hypothetical protein Hokovirus_1_63 [Hokovirus HKV1]|uniref:Uncharacterized protein n=1 Tax=Hokovirus HKV1 TaxID=1977638 RepID=A0A1V0SEY1_9VIRU|nr:hypothetical protein Hokovirus_1_63 [Hokovirus HKV1]